MKQQTSVGQRDKQNKNNATCSLLTQDENDHVHNLLGRKCLSMCTAVAQLFITEPPAHSHWKKRYTGALCFIKDSAKRSYYCRLYCLLRNELVWEQEMYDSIDITLPRPYLINMEGEDGLIALNFAAENEAETFYKISTATINNRNKRRQEKKTRRDPPPRPTSIPSQNTSRNNNNHDDDNAVVLRNPVPTFAPIPVQQIPQPFINMSYSSKDKKKYVRKFTKADISMPTNFKHVTHVGWTAQNGFDFTGEEAKTLKPFLQKAGVSDHQLKDRETRQFIYDFIHSHKVLDTVKSEHPNQLPPPPVPTRNQNQNGMPRIAPPPPPPPSRQPVAPPPVPSTPPSRVQPPRPPPVNTNVIQAVPPPPPPPPMPENVPPPPPLPIFNQESTDSKMSAAGKSSNLTDSDPRSALMESIRSGANKLKKVESTASGTARESVGDTRNDLLSAIRRGIELKPADTREINPASNRTSDTGTDALADALRRALAERGRVIHSSDDDSGSSENDGEWDD